MRRRRRSLLCWWWCGDYRIGFRFNPFRIQRRERDRDLIRERKEKPNERGREICYEEKNTRDRKKKKEKKKEKEK
jgi:hypothetical protein